MRAPKARSYGTQPLVSMEHAPVSYLCVKSIILAS